MTIFSTSSSRQILEDFSFRTWSGSRLIFGGYAAYAFEQEMNGPTWVQPAGRGPLGPKLNMAPSWVKIRQNLGCFQLLGC